MRIGLGLLRLPPEQFWSMTIPELEAAVQGAFGETAPATPLERTELEMLMQLYPDQ